MAIVKLVGMVVILAALASVIVFLSVLVASNGSNWTFADVVDFAKTTGLTVLVGGSLVAVLAVCFTYNKPDPDSLV